MTLPETEKSLEKDIKTSIADRRSMIELNSQNWKKNVEKDKVRIAWLRWQWFWWERYVGDVMMMTDLRCWWQNHYVGDFFCDVDDFFNV